MNPKNDALFQWLCNRDAGLPQLASVHSGENIEAFLESLLWENVISFAKEVLGNINCKQAKSKPLVQYISYPFYSHYREIKKEKPFWLSRFPVFFQNGPKDR